MKTFVYLTVVVTLSTIALSNEQSDKDYGDLFTSLQDDETIEKKSHDAEYVCIRRYVIQGHLTEHQIEENPKKINMFEINCQEVIRTAKNTAAASMAGDQYLTEPQTKCVKRKFLAGNYFDDMAVAIALRQSTLPPSKMVEEKYKFIERMKEMSRNLNECVMKKKKKKEESKEEKKEEENKEEENKEEEKKE